MFNHLHPQILASALRETPNEMCGYIVQEFNGITSFYQAKNIIPFDPKLGLSPTEAFAIAIDERAHVESLGEILAVVHSHTNANPFNGKLEFSSIDKAACNRGDIPWILVSLPDERFSYLQPNADEVVPLLGRPFFFGIWDCYSLVRDAIAEAGVKLRDYPRQSLDELEHPEWDLYEKFYETENFVSVPLDSDLQKYDLLFMRINSSKVNHAGIMIDPNRNIFYHHLINKLSQSDVWGGYWQKVCTRIVRHKQLF